MLRKILQTDPIIKNEDSRSRILAGIAPYLSNDLLRESLQVIQTIGDESFQAQLLTDLSGSLPELVKKDFLHRNTSGEEERIEYRPSRLELPLEISFILLEEFSPLILGEALRAARSIKNSSVRAKTLRELSPHFTGEAKEKVLYESLQATRAIDDLFSRARELKSLAPYLSEPLLREALQAGQAVPREPYEAQALAGLAPYLSEPLLREAFRVALTIQHVSFRATALAGLIPYLQERLRNTALKKILQSFQYHIGSYEARILVEVAHYIPERFLQETIYITRRLKIKHLQIWVLTSLIPNLSGKSEKDVLYKSLKITRGIEDNSARVWASIRVAEHLPSNLKEELLCEALQLARDIENDHIRIPLLKILGLSLATVSITDLYPLWKETLHILSARPRRFFCQI